MHIRTKLVNAACLPLRWIFAAKNVSNLAQRSRRKTTRRRMRLNGVETCEPRQLLAVTVTNLPATNITAESATIGIQLDGVEADLPTVSIYWGDNDAGTDVSLWDRTENLGTHADGTYSVDIAGLTAGTDYYYRAFAFSFGPGGQVWTESAEAFSTTALPRANVSLDADALTGDASAVVRGSFDGLGTLESATLYYGEADGGVDSLAWQQSQTLPPVDGEFSTILGNLKPGTQYVVRLAADNAGGTAWSEPLTLETSLVPDLRISEVMAANASTLPTRIRLNAENSFAGPTNSHDWIEIQNSTADPVDLSGYGLSDQVEQPHKWLFPAGTMIAPYDSILVFASSLDIADPNLDEQNTLHTNFSIGRNGEPLLLTSQDGSVVDQIAAEQLVSDVDVSLGYFGTDFGPLQTATPAASNAPRVARIETPAHRFTSADVQSPLVVTVAVESDDVGAVDVQLAYRVMFGDELTEPMRDDGVAPDATAGDGVFSAAIPGGIAQPGEMLRYAVRVRDADGIEARIPRFLTEDNSPEYLGTIIADASIVTEVPVLHRFIENARRAESGTGTRASVFYNGEFYDNVFIRIRGGTARSWPKKAYKIEFNDEYHFRFGADLPRVDELNLNTTFTDKAYMRAILSYELYRDSGGIAPITFPMRVQQNGEFWNVSHFVEQVDRDYLRRNGLDPDGALYKAMADRLNGLTGRAEGFFDKKTRHEEDASDLQGLIDGLALDGAELETFLFDNVDVAAQINLMASNLILQNLDATDKNYYIYRDTPGNQEWKMLPWDLDLVLGPNALNTDSFSTSDDVAPAHTSHPYMGTLDYPFHGRKNHLFHAIVNSPRTNEMFLRRVRSMMDEFLGAAETPVEQRYFENRIDELVELLGPDVLLDKEQWGNNASFGGTRYTLEEAGERIKDDYLVPRREHLFFTHNIDRLDTSRLKTLIPEFTDTTEYFVPTDNDLGLTWTDRAAPVNADQWQSGQLGIGFEEEPDDFVDLIKTRVKPAEACETCTSIFVRVPFSLDNAQTIEAMTLQMKFDDGFVAYINGVEVVRANSRDAEPGFESRGRSHRNSDAVRFENFDLASMIPQMDLGSENVLAIHLMNSSSTSNDALLSLQLVDGFVSNTTAVGIPHQAAANPAITFASFDQSPVSGNQDEEYVELHNPTGEAVDLSGWELRGGLAHVFRGGTVIPAGESLYVSPNSLAFRARSAGPTGGMGLFVQDGAQGHLSNRSELLELVDRNQQVVASLTTPDIASDLQQFLRVTELQYNPADATGVEFIELHNTSDTLTLDLNGATITDGPSEPFAFTGSAVTQLAPGAYALVVSDVAAFGSAYPAVDAARIAGAFAGALSNGGETIKIEDALNGTILEFRYEDGDGAGEEDWHATTDGAGYSLVIRNARAAIDSWGQGAGWLPSSQLGGSPGGPDGPQVDADFDANGTIDANDIDLLSAGVRAADLRFDLNQDGVADAADRSLLIDRVLGTAMGDSNLDGIFDSSDLVATFRIGQYEDSIAGNSGWLAGDWNGDGDFTTSDLVAAFQAGGYRAG